MRRFRFRLETVLDVRRLREREAQRAVAARRQELDRVEQLNRETRRAIAEQQYALRQAQRSGPVQPAALAQGRAWIAQLRNSLLQREALRRDLAVRLSAALQALRQARVQSRMIEKLRERRLGEHTRAVQRYEQNVSDELARQLPTIVGHTDEGVPHGG